MKMNILIVTSTRADFSLLKNLYKKLNASYTTKMLVTGTHLSKAYGYTIKEIKKSKINIYNTINWKSFSDNEINISRNFSKTLEQITAIFKKDKFDLLILLGDRYEILAAAISAHLSRVPIAHLHGGEVTGGVIDDAFRHSITKLSQIHFVANDTYKKRVIQLGEAPERVHNVGALGVENIKKKNFLKKNSKIIFFSSLAGSITKRGNLKHNKPFGNMIYRMSKSALNCGVKNLSYDFQKEHIIISLHPGFVKTKNGGVRI